MEENEDILGESKRIHSTKKKKKFVYLDKYEAYVESTNEKFTLGYAIMGLLALAIIGLVITR